MKAGLHPQLHETKITCNGCNTSFTLHTTVPQIAVEICSNCHPFYTGKQKLVDTAGRVEMFKQRQAAAAKAAEARTAAQNVKDAKLAKIQAELAEDTVAADAPAA